MGSQFSWCVALVFRLLLGFLSSRFSGQPTLVPWNLIEAEQPVEDVVGDDSGQRVPVQIGQDDNANLVGRKKRQLRAEAVDVPAMLHLLVPAVRRKEETHSITGFTEFFIGRRTLNDHLRVLHLHRVVFGKQLFARDLAVVHVEEQILAHILDVRVNFAGRTHGAAVRALCVEGDASQFGLQVTALAIRLGKVGAVLGVQLREIRAGHFQRLEDALRDRILPTGAVQLARNIARRHEHQVVVLECRAQRLAGLQILQAAQQILAREVRRVPDKIMPRKTGAMRNQIPDGHLLGEHRFVQLEGGQIIADRLVPIDFAFVHLHAQCCHGEGLGDRADREESIRRGRQLFLQIAVAVALFENYFVALHDCDSQSRHLPILHGLRDEVVQSVQTGLYWLCRCGIGCGLRGRTLEIEF